MSHPSGSTLPESSDQLVYQADDGTPVTTSLLIAEGTQLEHASVLKLVRTHLGDFEDFGRVRFEIRPFETPGGTQSRDVAVLNEHQATLLVTYLRNSDIVRAFKKQLVREFYAMRDMLVGHTSLSPFDLMRQQIDQLEAAQRTADEAKAIAERTSARVDGLEGRHDEFAALGYAKYVGLPSGEAFLRRLGTHATTVARAHGIEPNKTQHAHYGTVNLYPDWVWEAAAARLGDQ